MAERLNNKVAPASETKSDVTNGEDQSSIQTISVEECKSQSLETISDVTVTHGDDQSSIQTISIEEGKRLLVRVNHCNLIT